MKLDHNTVRNHARQISKNAKRKARRENSGCEICGFSVQEALHLHHIMPVAKGGDNQKENVILLCPNCHTLIHLLKSRRGIGPATLIAFLKYEKYTDEQIDRIFSIAGRERP